MKNKPATKATAMATPRSVPIMRAEEALPNPEPARFKAAWTRFWFTPQNPLVLHCLRVFVGLLFLAWLLPLAGHVDVLFSLNGWVDTQFYYDAVDPMRLPGGPPVPIGWSLLYLCGTDANLLQVVYWSTIAVLVLFTLGLWTRLTSILTWVLLVSFLANPACRFEGDYLLTLLAFYLMVGYVLLGQFSGRLTPLERFLGPRGTFLPALLLPRKPSRNQTVSGSFAVNLVARLLQINFALIVVVGGLHKFQYGDWWAGVAFWYPLHPPFETTAETIRKEAFHGPALLFFLSLAQYLQLAWQISFPVWAWRRSWRMVLLGGGILAWLACAFIFLLPNLGPFYFLGCLSFLTAEEWQWGLEKLTHGWNFLMSLFPGKSEPKPVAAVRN